MAYTNRGAAGMTPEQMEEEKRKKKYAKQPDGTFAEVPAQPNVGLQTGKVYPPDTNPNSVAGAAYETATTAGNELRPGIGVLSRAGETINRVGNRLQQNVTGAIDKAVPAEAFSTEKRGGPMTMDRAIPQGVRGVVPKIAQNVAMGAQSLPGIGEGVVPAVSRAVENIKKGEVARAAGNILSAGPRTVAAAAMEGKEHVIDPAIGAVKEAVPYWQQAGRNLAAGVTENPNEPAKPAGLPYKRPGTAVSAETAPEKATAVPGEMAQVHGATSQETTAQPSPPPETPGHGSPTAVNMARGTITTADGRTITAGSPTETSTETTAPAAQPAQVPQRRGYPAQVPQRRGYPAQVPQRRGYGVMPSMQPMETYIAEQPGYGLDPSLLGGKNYHGNKRREVRDANARRIAYHNAELAARQKDVDVREKDVAARTQLGQARLAADQQAAAQRLALDERRQAREEAKFATDAASNQAIQQQQQAVANLRQQLSRERDPKKREAIQQQISDLSGEGGTWKPARAQVGEDEYGEPVYGSVLVNDKGEVRRIDVPEEQPVRRTVDDYFK